MTSSDPDDLYGDLSETKLPPSTSKKPAQLKATPAAAAAAAATSNDNFASGDAQQTLLEKQVEDLAEENRRLKRNIGTLYRTAKAEIKRKDDEIARLLLEIEQLKK